MSSRAQHAAATAAQYEPTVDDVRRRIEAVEGRARALAADLSALRSSKEVSQKKLHELAHTMAALKTQQAAVVADTNAQVPRVKCVRAAGGGGRRGAMRTRRREGALVEQVTCWSVCNTSTSASSALTRLLCECHRRATACLQTLLESLR